MQKQQVPSTIAEIQQDADQFVRENVPDPLSACQPYNPRPDDAVDWQKHAEASLEKLNSYEKTAELIPAEKLPLIMGIDFNNGPARTAIVEKLADGGMIVHEAGSMSEEDFKKLARRIEADKLDKMVEATEKVADAFEVAGKAAQVFQTELKAVETVQLSADQPTISKHARGRTFPLPKRVWDHKKARRKQQAASRKRNRS